MKSPTSVKESVAVAPSAQGIYTDLFDNLKQRVTTAIAQGQCAAPADDCNDCDCDCECAPQCPDCDCN